MKAKRILELPGKKFAYLYWDTIDLASHLYGPGAEEVAGEIRMLDFQLGEFLDMLRKDTLFLMMADHGLIASGKSIDLGRHRKLIEMLEVPPTGETSVSFIHCKKGKKEKVREYIEGHFNREGFLLDSQEALKMGLFGTGKPFKETPYRAGDFVLVAKKDFDFIFPYLDQGNPKGRHGGLSGEEMLVPFLWKRG